MLSKSTRWAARRGGGDTVRLGRFWRRPQNRGTLAVTHFMDMPDLKWDKVEDGKYYMTRAQYDAGNEQL